MLIETIKTDDGTKMEITFQMSNTQYKEAAANATELGMDFDEFLRWIVYLPQKIDAYGSICDIRQKLDEAPELLKYIQNVFKVMGKNLFKGN